MRRSGWTGIGDEIGVAEKESGKASRPELYLLAMRCGRDRYMQRNGVISRAVAFPSLGWPVVTLRPARAEEDRSLLGPTG